MVICGHVSATRRRIDTNDFGHNISQFLVNYQSLHAGGNGYLRLIELDFVFNATMRHMTFSPFVLDLYKKKGENALGPHDHVAIVDENNYFTLPLDLSAQRFPDLYTAVPTDAVPIENWEWHNNETVFLATSLLDRVWTEIEAVPDPQNVSSIWQLPTHPEDYPWIDETLAHWRFDNDKGNGTALTYMDVIEDVTGLGNDMLVKSASTLLDVEYLTWSQDHHPLSSSSGSICFSNPLREVGSYLTTVADAPISSSDQVFRNGFTVEAFVKLSPSWDNLRHRWSGVVSRANAGRDAGKAGGDVNEPLAVLGVSPSREIQFASYPDNLDGIVTAWSSPLETDKFYHLAVVNNGEGTRMYIDGFRARRDPLHESQIIGIAGVSPDGTSTNKGWSIGSSTYSDRRKVFGGCIGEVRLVGRALAPSEFLIARTQNEAKTESPSGAVSDLAVDPEGTLPSTRFAALGTSNSTQSSQAYSRPWMALSITLVGILLQGIEN